MPTFISNGQTSMLVSLMMGQQGGTTVPLTTAITTFNALTNAPSATFTFGAVDNIANPVLFSNQPGGVARTGDYTAVAVGPFGELWGAGEVIGQPINNVPGNTNWATVVFTLGSE